MSGVNKAIIIGRVGRDPELRNTANGTSVVNFSVATSERFKRANGERDERTEWHNVSAWGKLAELCAECLRKGSQAYVEGRIQTDEYEKDGVKRRSTKIIAHTVQFLDPKQARVRGEDGPGGDPDEECPF